MACPIRLSCLVPGLARTLLAALAIWLPALPSFASDQVERGREIYNFRCYFCHGYAGDGRTLAARFLLPPPRNFSRTPLARLPRRAMIDAVAGGRPQTAMKPFAGVLTPTQIAAVVDFIRAEFMAQAKPNTKYHTADKGWPDHYRFQAAFPFATGAIPLDAAPQTLSPAQRGGRALYFSACISCHDRSNVREGAVTFEKEALSFPRFGFRPGDAQKPPDAVSGASPFARRDLPPRIEGLSALELEGERVFQANCAFCHAADGTGRNWVGRFLEPHPRDLTDPRAMAGKTRAGLRRVIQQGLPTTSMPAWGAVLTARQIEAVIAYISRAFYPLPSGPPSEAHPPAPEMAGP